MKAFGSRRAQRHVAAGSGEPITDGLVRWWKFDENAGTDALDSSGTGQTGSIEGADWTTDSKFGPSALSFVRANSDRVRLANATSYSPDLSLFTISVWFKTNADYSGTPGTLYSDYGINSHVLITLAVITDNKIQVSYRDGQRDTIEVVGLGPIVNDGVWHNIAGVRTSQTTMSAYLDGVLLGSDTNALTGQIITTTQHDALIGLLSQHNVNPFEGNIDDVRIYDRALTEQEISEIVAGTG